MGAKHTPGPWRVETDTTPWTEGDATIAVEYGEAFGRTVLLTPVTAPDAVEAIAFLPWEACEGEARQGELRANARVIASAPELVEALRQAVEVLDADGIVYGDSPYEALDVLQVARALLARIEGADPDEACAPLCASRVPFGECTCGAWERRAAARGEA